MNKERSKHGFGLAVFGILLLAIAFLTVFYYSNALVASIIAFLSAIMAAAAYFEARRADGPRAFTLTILVLTLLGTFIVLVWSGNLSRFTEKRNGSVLIKEHEENISQPANEKEKMKDMEKVIEQLESDSSKAGRDTTR